MNVVSKAFLDLQQYRDYVAYSVRVGLKRQTTGTVLGSVWWILDPLMFMLVYVLVIKVIFQRGGPGFSVFVLCALVPWKWTVTSVISSTSSIRGNMSVLQQIYVPKHLLVLVTLLTTSVSFIFGVAVLLVMLRLFHLPVTFHYLEFIPVCAAHFCLLLGMCLVLSHVGVFFRDINNILQFATRLWFFLSPALYDIERIPEKVRYLWWLNPLTTFYVSYRNVLMYGKPALWGRLGAWAVIGLLLGVVGLRLLQRFDRNYTKVV